MRLDQPVERRECSRAGSDLVGERRQTDLHALAGIAVALTVERLMRSELLEHDHRQKARAEQSRAASRGTVPEAGSCASHARQANRSRTVCTTFHCRGITSSVSVTSSPSFDSRSDPQQAQLVGAGNDDALARQMRRQRLARGSCPGERLDSCAGRGTLAQSLILAGARLQLLQAQLELVDQQLAAFGTLAIQRAAHLLVLQLEQGHPRRQISVDRLRAGSFGLGI